MKKTQRIITGIKPTNQIHIGNYIGAVKQIEEMQAKKAYEIFLFVPDLHSFTYTIPKKEEINLILKFYIACCGKKNIIFYKQSDFPEFAHLSWFFSCSTPVGQLQRMTQFKSQKSEQINSGYLYYPVLMAADILGVNADIVPVGVDQQQHVELTRDICLHVNQRFGNIFTPPSHQIQENTKIMSLKNPEEKMSKSQGSAMGVIFINDSMEDIEKKIKKATTDSEKMPTDIVEIQKSRPGVFNLCLIFKEITKKSFKYIEETFGGKNIGDFKMILIKEVQDFLQNLQNKINSISDESLETLLESHRGYVRSILTQNIQAIEKQTR